MIDGLFVPSSGTKGVKSVLACIILKERSPIFNGPHYIVLLTEGKWNKKKRIEIDNKEEKKKINTCSRNVLTFIFNGPHYIVLLTEGKWKKSKETGSEREKGKMFI
jgi:hypothetical protein